MHGDEVTDGQEWTAVMESRGDDLEVLNFGVSGYGPGQAYLRWERDGRPLRPHVVLIGLLSENPYRSVNVFRPFYDPSTQLVFAKPRFKLGPAGLELVANPFGAPEDYAALLASPVGALRNLGRNDYFFRNLGYTVHALDFLPSVQFGQVAAQAFRTLGSGGPPIVVDGSFNPESEAVAVTLGILEKFSESVREDGARPIVVFFPHRDDFAAAAISRIYQPLVDAVKAKGIEAVDVFEALSRAEDPDDLFADHHYSPLGNELVADHLLSVVQRAPSRRFRTLSQSKMY